MSKSKSRKVLVTGADGMLGTDLQARLKQVDDLEIVAVTVDIVDISDLVAVRDQMLEIRPDIVIHCAGYTAVDQAEKEADLAHQVNSEGTKHIAFFCRELDAEMYYISTDYVFDGLKDTPYKESDEPNPINTYGKSKLAGERHVEALVPRYKICRTSSLCGVHGVNFVESILKAASRQKTISVVNDQISSPTFTVDFADMLVQLLDVNESGIFHITNSGYCSWYEFAKKIVELSNRDKVRVRPITSSDFRSLAKRPPFSVLGNFRIEKMGLKPMPRWDEGLKRYLEIKKKLKK